MADRNEILTAFAHFDKLRIQKETVGQTNQLVIDQVFNVLAKVYSVSPEGHGVRTEVDAILNDKEFEGNEFIEKLKEFISSYKNHKGVK